MNSQEHRTPEEIVEIHDLEDKEGWTQRAGYEVVTTQQRIRLLIDNSGQCCENWGWFWCNDNPQDFIGAQLRSIGLTDAALNEAHLKANSLDPSDKYFEGGIMFVNLETDRGTLQFVAYNQHNGYYAHTATVESAQLKHEESL